MKINYIVILLIISITSGILMLQAVVSLSIDDINRLPHESVIDIEDVNTEQLKREIHSVGPIHGQPGFIGYNQHNKQVVRIWPLDDETNFGIQIGGVLTGKFVSTITTCGQQTVARELYTFLEQFKQQAERENGHFNL